MHACTLSLTHAGSEDPLGVERRETLIKTDPHKGPHSSMKTPEGLQQPLSTGGHPPEKVYMGH